MISFRAKMKYFQEYFNKMKKLKNQVFGVKTIHFFGNFAVAFYLGFSKINMENREGERQWQI
jgi:uncharacterized membrane protein (Fun14 family)